jgi:hypothetical protein
MQAADDIMELKLLAICVIAFLVIVSFHLIGLHSGIRLLHRRKPAPNLKMVPFGHMVVHVVGLMAILFGLHLLTNFAWGGFIYGMGILGRYRDCVFFSLENYTSEGLTQVTVPDEWRMLAPMISLSGVFCLAWSTAVLVSVFAQIYSPLSAPPREE